MCQHPNQAIFQIYYSYYPCVFVLKPGQLLHINKGRLHAFRKMSSSPLEANDCHCAIRQEIIKDFHIKKDTICRSLAWDWMFLGNTCKGIQAEIAHTLESAKLAKEKSAMILAIPKISIIKIAILQLSSMNNANGKFKL